MNYRMFIKQNLKLFRMVYLETSALIGQLADAVEHDVDDLLANCVVATGVVVGGILLTGDQLLRVEELAVSTRANLIFKPNWRFNPEKLKPDEYSFQEK